MKDINILKKTLKDMGILDKRIYDIERKKPNSILREFPYIHSRTHPNFWRGLKNEVNRPDFIYEEQTWYPVLRPKKNNPRELVHIKGYYISEDAKFIISRWHRINKKYQIDENYYQLLTPDIKNKKYDKNGKQKSAGYGHYRFKTDKDWGPKGSDFMTHQLSFYSFGYIYKNPIEGFEDCWDEILESTDPNTVRLLDWVINSFCIDHLNGNTFDNRIENLRATNPKGNAKSWINRVKNEATN